LSGVFVVQAPYVKGEISEKDMMEIVAKNHVRDEKASHAVLWMLTKFYFPDVEPALLVFDRKRAAINSIVSAHRRNAVAYKVFDDAWGQFNEASDALIASIVARGKSFQEIPIPFGQAFSEPSDSKSATL